LNHADTTYLSFNFSLRSGDLSDKTQYQTLPRLPFRLVAAHIHVSSETTRESTRESSRESTHAMPFLNGLEGWIKRG
jgi:hypothetical protein